MTTWAKWRKSDKRPTPEELEEERERREVEERVRKWISESKRPAAAASEDKKQDAEEGSHRSTAASNESTNSAKTDRDRPPLDTLHEGIIHAVSAVHDGIVNLPSGILAHAESVFSIADAWNSAASCQTRRSTTKSRVQINPNGIPSRDGDAAKPETPQSPAKPENRSQSPSLSRKESGALTEQRLPSAAAGSGSGAAAGGNASVGAGPGLSRSSSLRSATGA